MTSESTKDMMIVGGKGGGSTFRNRPDNLRSTDTFEALIGLVTGPIKGLAPGGLQNMFVDDVPIEDGSGNKTLDDFSVLLFNGDPAVLEPVKLQLGGSAGSNSVNLAVNNANAGATTTAGPAGDWRFASVTQPNVDYIDLRFVVNQLFKQDKNGIYDLTASVEIQLQPSGSSTWINPLISTAAPTYNEDGVPVGVSKTQRIAYLQASKWDSGDPNQWAETAAGYLQITGKTTQSYVKELRIAVPNTGAYANKTWQIRCRLMERDSYTNDQDEERRTILWESVAGVTMDPIGNTEAWRGLAYIQVNGKASDQLSGIPTVEGIYDLSMVKVPPASVWNAETRVYTGATWDGSTEEIKWTTCPAFQLRDLIEDDISGLSAMVPGSTLNKWDALEASKWYAQLVPDGKGGYHPRYSMNYLLNQSLSVNELIQYVCGATGSYAWDRGDGHWRLVVEKPENPTAIFTKENIVGEFTYSHTDIDSRYNEIIGVFKNEENRYQEDRVRVFDQPHIDNYGRRSTTLALVGCTNRQEALRRIKIRQLSSLYETKQVAFTTNRQGLLLHPFSVIAIADGDLGDSDARTTGRLVDIDGSTLKVRDYVRLELGVSYTLNVTVPNPDYNPDTISQPSSADWKKPTITITRNIINNSSQRGDVKTLYLDSPLPANTPANAPIAFSAVGLPTIPKQYRVVELSPIDDELVAVTAVEIYTSKWVESDTVDEGEILAQVPNKTVPSPTNITFSVDSFTSNFQNKRVLAVSWVRPPTFWFNGFKVEYRFNGGPPIVLAPNTQDSFAELQEPENGQYEFFVYTLDRRKGVSLPLKGSYLLGEVPPPGSSVVSTSVPTFTVNANYLGTVNDGQLPFNGWAKYTVGDVDYTSEAVWTLNSSGCTAIIGADGTWQVTQVANTGYLDVTGTYLGTSITRRIVINKNIDTTNAPAGGSGSSSSSITTFATVNSSTYPSTPTYTAIVKSSSTGKLQFQSSITYAVGGGGGDKYITLAGKVVYRIAGSGSGWTDATSELIGTEAFRGGLILYEDFTYYEGSLNIAPTVLTGLTANTDYEFGFLSRIYNGNVSSNTPYGTIIAEAIS